jgi:predicted dehydrogenase
MRRIRLGQVGGGHGAFIGAVHRIAARLDDHYELVAAALSADPQRARESARDLGLAPERTYASYEHMAAAESARPDGVEAVVIATPNDSHAAIARVFLSRGIHVICDKPLTTSMADARELRTLARQTRRILAVTYNYTGYAMVRHARELCRSGALGTVRLVDVQYLQEWLTTDVAAAGNKQAQWRADPARAGAGGAIADIGTHAYHLLRFVTGLRVQALCAELTHFVAGRRVDDDARMLLRLEGGARGVLWVSQVAPGNENELSIRVYGDRGSLQWLQSEPDRLAYAEIGRPRQIITRGSPAAGEAARRVTRIPAGHPEGYLEAFATLYTEIAAAIRAAEHGEPLPEHLSYPDVDAGLEGVEFIDAVLRSDRAGSSWVGYDAGAVTSGAA